MIYVPYRVYFRDGICVSLDQEDGHVNWRLITLATKRGQNRPFQDPVGKTAEQIAVDDARLEQLACFQAHTYHAREQ